LTRHVRTRRRTVASQQKGENKVREPWTDNNARWIRRKECNCPTETKEDKKKISRSKKKKRAEKAGDVCLQPLENIHRAAVKGGNSRWPSGTLK